MKESPYSESYTRKFSGKLLFIFGNSLYVIFIELSIDKSLFVDELDSQLHPLLTRKIVELFNCTDSNPHGAQLIFTTHDTNMLSKKLLRRDQVLFVEKDKKAMTRITPMLSLKLENGAKPRTDSNYEKNYLEGKYGAIPYYEKDFEGCNE